MTKADLVETLQREFGFQRSICSELIDQLFEILKESIATEGKVKISGFGNFMVREKKARKGRNPQTGEALEISARQVVTFKSSIVLREKVNQCESSAGKESE